MKNKNILILLAIELILVILLAIGSQTVFKTCIHEDGHGICYYAQIAVLVESIGLAATLAAGYIFREHKTLLALSSAGFVQSLFILLTPKVFFPLCKMDTMACLSKFYPFVLLMSILLMIFMAINIAYAFLKIRKDK